MKSKMLLCLSAKEKHFQKEFCLTEFFSSSWEDCIFVIYSFLLFFLYAATGSSS